VLIARKSNVIKQCPESKSDAENVSMQLSTAKALRHEGEQTSAEQKQPTLIPLKSTKG